MNQLSSRFRTAARPHNSRYVPISCCPARRPLLSCQGALRTAADAATKHKRVLVTSLGPARQPAPPPQPVPVEHSPAYLQRDRQPLAGQIAMTERVSPDEEFTGSAVEWALRQVDARLDEAAGNPPAPAVAIWNAARGPVGTATAKGVGTAAKVTVKVGAEALKAAAPVGKWAMQQGVKAALGVFTSSQSKKRDDD
ncbi:hypothetical protein WJX72_003059 [[Myrmecia] bisecta]|uniref:Uncharacterized protein n=1 Tax=[Myrmecia] bisecta TaxID=41462 RepID=A0AAW1PFA1_9CHLO